QEMLRLQVKVPAVGLMLTGAVAVVFWLIMAILFATIDRQWWHGQEHYYDLPGRNIITRSTDVHFATDLIVGSLLALALAGAASLLMAGARSMMRLERYEFAVFASIWAMVPWSGPGTLVGVPFGIISLVMLLRPNVKAVFARNALRSRSRVVTPPT